LNCTPDCEGKICGDDGCGKSCGVCDDGSSCQDGTCIDDCVPACQNKSCGADGCGDVCGVCDDGELCNASGKCAPECVGSCANKDCGSDGCGVSCGACDADQTCNASGKCIDNCVGSCAGKQCGDDGCGVSCGACAPGSGCNAAGKCVANCTPNCTGKTCGANGCGGTCGTCFGGETCVIDVCASTPTEPVRVQFNGAIVGPGKANGTPWDGPGTITAANWSALLEALLGDAPVDDTLALLNGVLGGFDKPDPTVKVEFAPQGSYDPALSGDLVTDADNQENTYTPQWPGNPGYNQVTWHAAMKFKVTLTDEDLALDDPMGAAEIHAGHIAAAWKAGGVYSVPVFDQTDNQVLFLEIEVKCSPDCSGKSCGDDGCGGVCGTCPNATSCVAGKCQGGACGSLSQAGCCDGQQLYWCDANVIQGLDCTASPSCGWSPDNSWYDCGTDGSADPSGSDPITCPF